MSAYNFGVRGVARQNFGTWRVSKSGVLTQVQILKTPPS